MPRNTTILLAEDDPDLRLMVSRMLGTVADVRLAKDGMEAYSSLRSDAPLPNLVITDVMMPRMDGIQLLRRMKSDSELNRVPVIVMTAKGDPRDVVSGINAGARHYITKPFKQSEFLAKVKKVLKSRAPAP